MPVPASASPPALVATQAPETRPNPSDQAAGNKGSDQAPNNNGSDKGDQVDYWTRRHELAGFPIIGGNSDIGFQFGGVGTLSYFEKGIKPYAWNADLVISLSLKGGAGVAQQSYLTNIDVPGLFNGGVRINPQAAFQRTVNQNYFGLGNDSSAAPPPGANTSNDHWHQFIENVMYLRFPVRILLGRPVYALLQPAYRYAVPESYPVSDLTRDEGVRLPDGSTLLFGTRPVSLVSVAGGFVYDDRDNEVFTRSGMYHQAGVRYEQGIPFDANVSYGEAGVVLSGFVPLAGPLILAGRAIASFQFGQVPFFDLFQAGPFQLKDAPGGSTGVRGVPIGRYSGPIKAVANIEFRALLLHFTLFKQKFSIGGDVFFDTGRIWSDYSFHSPLDGGGLGLKYGIGGGMYWRWGQAAIFRIEAAYSPDAVSENPGLPLGLYFEDGTMF